MNVSLLRLTVLLMLFSSLASAQATGMQEYKDGNYRAALPLLKSSVSAEPKDAALRAALLSSLVYEGQVDEASDCFDEAAEAFPNSPEVLAARGEFVFYMGDMAQAEKLFKSAVMIKDATPRATYGLARLYASASLHHTSRLLMLRAHDLAPDDALITRAWLPYLIPEKRKELLGPFMAAHPWFYKYTEMNRSTDREVNDELNHRKIYELDGTRQETTLNLVPLMYSAQRQIGIGVTFSIEDGHKLTLMLDTGASGIVLNQNAVDKIGLNHLGTTMLGGIGDQGYKNGFMSIGDTCQIDTLKYKTCLFRVAEGKHVAGNYDGLIGTDFFASYLVQIDFQKHQLHLAPHPPREPNPQGYDRAPLSTVKDFTPIFQYGHHLYVSTRVNGKTQGLFLIDTGAASSLIDETFARLSTKLYANSWMHIKGVSGNVKNVFEASKAELQFATFRQDNLGITAVNLNNSPDHQDLRMSGILGYPLLSMFRLTLDYRNGFVKFDYINR